MSISTEHITTTKPFVIAPGVAARILQSSTGYMELVICMDESLSLEAIHDAWETITEHRDQLLIPQLSTTMPSSLNTLMLLCHSLHQKNITYQEIATQLNTNCAIALYQVADVLEHHLFLPDNSWSYDSFFTAVEAYYRAHPQIPWYELIRGWECFSTILRSMQMKEKDIRLWFNVGLKNVQSGDIPWKHAPPLDKDRVREALRYWKNQSGFPPSHCSSQRWQFTPLHAKADIVVTYQRFIHRITAMWQRGGKY
jgi:hypothetical protein